MKKLIVIFSLLLAFSLVFCGCFPRTMVKPDGVMVIPDNDAIGEPMTFETEGIKLTLTDKFIEKESELGFYAYYVSNFCGVVVLKEDFSLEEGLADRSLEEYVGSVIANNGHTDIKPQNKDDLWFYVRDSGGTRTYSYSFKGSDAFWIVQYLCMTSDAPMLEDLFYLWANCVEVE
ncbi:MAG: hypothetical protein IIW56_09870 [Oscillospiraceae bacterium]|nr:hypothetical protein [Oscillospiraceae bacterium]